MLEMIEHGEANAMVAWHPNRLSRNELDSAAITYLLRSKLKDLKFCSYNFDNSPEGIMMLQMVMNQSQYESSKQGKDVKRGMEQKAIGGEKPGQVPQGYLKTPVLDKHGNFIRHKDKLVTETTCDPERFDMVQKMWKMLIYGDYTPSQICKIANEQWKYTLRKTEHTGGGPMGKSTIYRIFINPFYAGYMLHNAELHKGNHKPMITLKEFNYAQKLLGKRGKPRMGKVNNHPYGSIIVCGECGCQIVVKTSTKLIKSTGELKTYVHYHCTRKSVNRPCNQRSYTTLEKLEQDIDAELARFTIIPEFQEVALKVLRQNHKAETTDRTAIYKQQQKHRNNIQAQLDELVAMRSRNLLDDDEYKIQRNKLKLELGGMDEDLRGTEDRAEQWLELTEKVFDLATYGRIRLHESKDPKVKRDILLGLGENFTLKDNKLSLTPHEWLIPIESDYPALFREYERARTDKKLTAKVREETIERIFESWRAQWDSNPRHPA
jgi:site-specific DNA recombinase